MRWLFVVIAAVLTLAAAMNRQRASDLLLSVRIHVALERLNEDLDAETLPSARFSAIHRTGAHASTRSAAELASPIKSDAAILIGIAGESSSSRAVAATAAALVISRDIEAARKSVEAGLARTPSDARLWSDLAAIHYEADHPLQALVAADKALRIDEHLPEALFNRGLALERLGLTSVAAASWRACLLESTDAELAATVRDRLRVVEAPSESARWRSVMSEYLRAAAAGEDATVARMTREFPLDARRTAETVLLRNWADAVSAHDAARSSEVLRILHSASRALADRGVTVLADVLRVIDTAMEQNDSARIELLARAHLSYDQGRRANGVRDYAQAERELDAAVKAFHTARSPMENVARSWRANVLISLSKVDEARPILIDVLATERRIAGHRALTAQSAFFLGICETVRGDWNAAADLAREAQQLYRSLGETANVADSAGLLAEIFDLLGQPDAAWEHRPDAFRAMSASGAADRLLASIGSAERGAMHRGEYDVALSLLDVEASLVADVHDPLFAASMHRRRALVEHALGMAGDRDISMARARVAIDANKDPVGRAWLAIELDTTEAVMVRDRDPQRAIRLLDGVVAFVREGDRRFELPEALLQRGRAFVAAGQDDRAWVDLSEALTEVEGQRSGISDMALRSRMLDTSEELFHEAIALLVRRGDAEEAFVVAERARARMLLDVLGGVQATVSSAASIAKRLDPGTLLVEYAVLPGKLVIFSIRDDGIRMKAVDIDESSLLSGPNPERFLLEPIRDEVAAARSLIFVPDDVLQRTQFDALRWSGRYFVETHTISEAPSASRLVASPVRTRIREGSILIVGNPAPDEGQKLDRLPSVQREIERIAPLYQRAHVLFGKEATKARFTAEAPGYDIIHFAGHGLSDEESLTASLVFAHGANDSGRMESNEIAALRLPLAPLVVLDACGTLRGRIMGVEGMPSLVRSFLAAGASAVVGTLDDIDDERSASLIIAFHHQMTEGASAPDALRAAQLQAIRRGGAAADPKNWAPFVVYTATP